MEAEQIKRRGRDVMQGDVEPWVIEGRVKWFDPTKGFGFIVANDGGPDILLHVNVLRNFGQSSVADGAGISARVQDTQRGLQAVEVLSIEPPELQPIQLSEEMAPLDHDDLMELPLEPARVKWFDKAKGYGFANIFGRPEDVFLHIEVLRRSGFADLPPGEAVGLRSVEGPRGRMAVQVTPWEVALRPTGP
jgi:cold shock protein